MDSLFSTDKSFRDLGLTDSLLKGVEKLGFTHPTKAQADMVPLALAGRDVLGQSRTGTGKTAAFGLPLLLMIDLNTPLNALVLVPTRELAIQVTHEIRELGTFTDVKTMAVYGGQRIQIQAEKLKKNPHLIIGTPGRVMDMHRRNLLPYDDMKFAVLDEVDRMLDIGFRDDIRSILGAMRQRPQTIFVSATISPEIERLARTYMRNPEKLIVSTGGSLTVAEVDQRYFSVEPWDKSHLLLHLLKHEEPTLTLIFCRTKHTVDALSDYLRRKKLEVHAIHGDMYQQKRDRVIKKLREGELQVLVASDLAARGLDVDDISHVINYDVPEDPEIYIHRIGRTARAGRGGVAWTFVTPDQGELLSNIERLTNVEIKIAEYDDFRPGPIPAAVMAQRERAAQREQEIRIEFNRSPTSLPSNMDAADTSKWPDGQVPIAAPKKRLGGRLRSRRR